MKKRVLCLMMVFVLIFSTNVGTSKAEAAIKVNSIPRTVLKAAFVALRGSVSSTTTNVNYKANCTGFFNNIFSFVYDQNKLHNKVWVGSCSFKEVGCELAACYNAIYKLVGSVTAGGLPEIIKIAESKKYTMSLSKEAIKKIASLAGVSASDIKEYSKPSSFGTDPFTIPSILSARGYVKAKTTFNSYSSMNTSVKNAISKKESHVYIVSYWNYDTLEECLNAGSGFHTVCFYTENGRIFDLNNSNLYTTKAREVASFNQVIKNNSGHFIVGYEIVKK